MVEEQQETPKKEPYIDGILKKNLTEMKKDMKKDDDVVLIVDGKEGIGKSVFAMRIGHFMSEGKLNLDDLCCTPKQFKERTMKSKKYDVVIFDEAYLGLASEDTMRSYNRLLKKMLVTCRQMNLCLILVLPSVFDLNKYAVLHRSDGLLHCFKYKGSRGFFSFYNQKTLQQLYIRGKRYYQYKMRSNFFGRFTNFYPVDEEKYRKKKWDSQKKYMEMTDDASIPRAVIRFYNSVKFIKENFPDHSQRKLATKLGCSQDTIRVALAYKPKENAL